MNGLITTSTKVHRGALRLVDMKLEKLQVRFALIVFFFLFLGEVEVLGSRRESE